jgi:hypothetical protein
MSVDIIVKGYGIVFQSYSFSRMKEWSIENMAAEGRGQSLIKHNVISIIVINEKI